jgi:hypothetical protein
LEEGYREGHACWENEEEDVSSYRMTLSNERILYIEKGSTGLQSLGNKLWKILRTSHKTVYGIN